MVRGGGSRPGCSARHRVGVRPLIAAAAALSVAAALLSPVPAAAETAAGFETLPAPTAASSRAGALWAAPPSRLAPASQAAAVSAAASSVPAAPRGPAASGLFAAAPGAVALAQPGGFGDVAGDAYYSEPVAALAAMGVFEGTECDAGFCPDDSIDRKTMAVWVVRVLDGSDPVVTFEAESRFDDVNQLLPVWWVPFIERMADLGVTRGCGDGTNFCPNDSVTRAQMAVFLSRAYSLPAGPDPGFSDVDYDDWYAPDVTRLAASGITKGCGDGTVFCPGQDTTRAQMATFLWRAKRRRDDTPAVEVPIDGVAVTVPAGGSFVAEFDSVTVDAPPGALSAEARVSLSETSLGTADVVEGEELATTPIAVSITGAEIVRPLTLRFEVDTSSLSPTGVVPAWWSDELGAWVPLDAQSVVIGDGEVTVRADLADVEAASVVTAYGPVVFAGSAGPTAHALAIPAQLVIGLIVFGAITVGVGVVALTSDSVHDALKRLFGLGAVEPVCGGGLPQWVAGVSHSDEGLSPERARLHACGESVDNDLRVKVANNRNYGIELKTSEGGYPVSLPGGNNPTGLLEIAIKETCRSDHRRFVSVALEPERIRAPRATDRLDRRLAHHKGNRGS